MQDFQILRHWEISKQIIYEMNIRKFECSSYAFETIQNWEKYGKIIKW